MYKAIDNNPMNKFNKFINHKGHIERLYTSKSVIKNKSPLIPSFILKGIKPKGLEKKFKISYENENLFKKLVEIFKTNSKYNRLKIKPAKCPAFERKGYFQIKKIKDIIHENNSFYKVLKRSKSTMNYSKIENDFLNSRYYKKNISKNNVVHNPNLLFATYQEFNKNLKNRMKEFVNQTTVSIRRRAGINQSSNNSKYLNKTKTFSGIKSMKYFFY